MSINKSKPNTSTSSSQTSKPISLQDVEGVSIVGNEGPVQITDGGAIASNRDVMLSAIEKAAELTLGLVSAQAAASPPPPRSRPTSLPTTPAAQRHRR